MSRATFASGACNCGAVAFEITTPIRDVYVCHCSICRRYTGSGNIAVVVIPNGNFRWTRGEETIQSWNKPNHDWQAWFCPVCGSALPGTNDKDHMFVPAGLISSGSEDLVVAHRICVSSKANWDVIGDSAQQHADKFGS